MLKKKTKLIILGTSVVILTSTIFSTVAYRESVNKTQKQKIVESNILFSKISAKKILDKKIADKKIANDKRIAAKKIADAKILAKKIADKKIVDKKIADEKIRIAKLNEGMTQSKALAMAYKLHPDCNFKLSDGTELVKNNAYYEFKLFELDWSDGGSDWFFVVNKKTGLAYRHYSDNSLVRDLKVTPPVIKNTIVSFTVDNNIFTKYNYPNGATLYFKVGDTLTTQATVLNKSVIRTMELNGEIFSTLKIMGDSLCLKMVKTGTSDLEIVPDYSDWNHAHIMHIVVTD